MENINEKKVVVIGGTSGLGLVVAKTFLNHNFRVIVGSRTQEKIDKAIEFLENKVETLKVDITDDNSVIAFFNSIGNFEHIVITSSIAFADRPIGETTIEELKTFSETKLWGAIRCIKFGIDNINPGGSITLVSGAVSKKGRSGAHAKTITNTALEGITRSFAAEFGPRVRINCISPGMFDSKGLLTPAKKEEIGMLYPLKYVGDSKDVSDLVFSIATNSFMTGSVVYIDGGWTAI